MTDDIQDIIDFYNTSPEREHSRLEENQLEYELTCRYLDRYLPSTGNLMEVGSATGRYTVKLAQWGYHITAVDLSARQLAWCRNQLEELELADRTRFLSCDIRHLSMVPDEMFDAVLLMGPLYHLIEETDRKKALQEVFLRLRPGAVLFSAFISRYGIMGDLMKNIPHWVEKQAEVQSVLELGRDTPRAPRGGFRGYFARVPEIIPLHEEIGFETITLAGVEPAISADDESYNRLRGTQRKLWLDVLDQISTEPSLLGASRHLLYIGRKSSP